MPFTPKKIYIDKDAENFPLTQNVLNNLKGVPAEVVDGVAQLSRDSILSSDPVKTGKEILFITCQRGRFLKKCPGTGKVLCCNYYVVNFASNCNLDCSYCFLQHYSNTPFLTLYANTDDLLKEIDVAVNTHNNSPIRIGTGEFTDSLSLDNITGFTNIMVQHIAGRRGVILEFKTKSCMIENLISNNGSKNIIVSWSLNPPHIVSTEERYTATLDERINAAVRCTAAGYSVGFHFDPIIYYRDWETDYENIVSYIFRSIDPSFIAWISLGSLRFHPSLKPVIENRFPESRILSGEFIVGDDGKLRYPRIIRERIFRTMSLFIRNYSESVPVYLCMETPIVWKNSFAGLPKNDCRLSGIF